MPASCVKNNEQPKSQSLPNLTDSPVFSEAKPTPPADSHASGDASSLTEEKGVVYLMAVAFKEATLDSPTFRASMNHINDQLESLDRWIDSLTKALNKITSEMDSK